jgi:hypothetical protein
LHRLAHRRSLVAFFVLSLLTARKVELCELVSTAKLKVTTMQNSPPKRVWPRTKTWSNTLSINHRNCTPQMRIFVIVVHFATDVVIGLLNRSDAINVQELAKKRLMSIPNTSHNEWVAVLPNLTFPLVVMMFVEDKETAEYETVGTGTAYVNRSPGGLFHVASQCSVIRNHY